jgi:hypothetical protein
MPAGVTPAPPGFGPTPSLPQQQQQQYHAQAGACAGWSLLPCQQARPYCLLDLGLGQLNPTCSSSSSSLILQQHLMLVTTWKTCCSCWV